MAIAERPDTLIGKRIPPVPTSSVCCAVAAAMSATLICRGCCIWLFCGAHTRTRALSRSMCSRPRARPAWHPCSPEPISSGTARNSPAMASRTTERVTRSHRSVRWQSRLRIGKASRSLRCWRIRAPRRRMPPSSSTSNGKSSRRSWMARPRCGPLRSINRSATILPMSTISRPATPMAHSHQRPTCSSTHSIFIDRPGFRSSRVV